jgi:hypothetical protein
MATRPAITLSGRSLALAFGRPRGTGEVDGAAETGAVVEVGPPDVGEPDPEPEAEPEGRGVAVVEPAPGDPWEPPAGVVTTPTPPPPPGLGHCPLVHGGGGGYGPAASAWARRANPETARSSTNTAAQRRADVNIFGRTVALPRFLRRSPEYDDHAVPRLPHRVSDAATPQVKMTLAHCRLIGDR